MPLFSLAIHDALAEVTEDLEPGEHLFAFLDDVHVLSLPHRTRAIHNLLGETLQARDPTPRRKDEDVEQSWTLISDISGRSACPRPRENQVRMLGLALGAPLQQPVIFVPGEPGKFLRSLEPVVPLSSTASLGKSPQRDFSCV